MECSTWIYSIVLFFACMGHIHCFSTESNISKTPVGTKSVQCLPNEYGDNCSYCVPKDTCISGHYTCDYDTGNKVCLSGWSGKSCRIRTEPDMRFVSCPDNQCRNGGSCISGQCCCVDGFTGILCEIEIIECTNTSCQNGGICKDLIGRYECLCKDQYTGDQCEVPPSASVQTTPHNDGGCQYDTCFNNGTCFEDAIFTYCLCPTWFTGARCETSLRPQQTVLTKTCPEHYYGPLCDSFCVNTDSCVGGHYVCNELTGDKVCMSGWIGDNCDTRLLPPPLDPYCPSGLGCKNDGQCDRGSCCCKHDHSGDLCEIQSIGCVSSPCINNGTCLEENGSFKCLCLSGFSGRFCDVDLQTLVSSIVSTSKTSTTMLDVSSSSIPATFDLTSSERFYSSHMSSGWFEFGYQTSSEIANTISTTDISPTINSLPSGSFSFSTVAIHSMISSDISAYGLHESISTNINTQSSYLLDGSLNINSSDVQDSSLPEYTSESLISSRQTSTLTSQSSFRETDSTFISAEKESSNFETVSTSIYKTSVLPKVLQEISSVSTQMPFITNLSSERSELTIPKSVFNSQLFPTSLGYHSESIPNTISTSMFNSPHKLISSLISTTFETRYSDDIHFGSSLLISDRIETNLNSQPEASYRSTYHQSQPYNSLNSYTDNSKGSSQGEHINSQMSLSPSERVIYSSSISHTPENSAFGFSPYTSNIEIVPSFSASMPLASMKAETQETTTLYSSQHVETVSSVPLFILPSQQSYSLQIPNSLPSGKTNTQRSTSSIPNNIHLSTVYSNSLSSSLLTNSSVIDMFKKSTVVPSIKPTSVMHRSSESISSVGNSENKFLKFQTTNVINLPISSFIISDTSTPTIKPTVAGVNIFSTSQVRNASSLAVKNTFSSDIIDTVSVSKTISPNTTTRVLTEPNTRLGISATQTFSLSSQYGNEASLVLHTLINPTSAEENNTLVWWIILIIVLSVVVIGASLIIVALIVMRKRRSDFRAIEQNPEAVLAYDKEHFSFQPDIANPTFEPEDDSDDDSVKHDIYIVNK